MRRRVVALGLVLAVAAAATVRADDPTEPKYADKPATWWIGEYLGGEDPEAARNVLRRMGEQAAPWIAARLASAEKSADRCKLLGLLDAMREVPPAAVAALRPSLRSGNSSEQIAALHVVVRARRAPVELADDVAALLRSPSADVRSSAATALGSLGVAAEPEVAALLAMTGAGKESERLAAVTALGRLGTRAASALPALLDAAAARVPQTHYVRALASIGSDDPRVADAIVRAVESGDERTRSDTLEVLRETGPVGDAVARAAERLADSKDAGVRTAAAQALGRVALARGSVPDTLIRLLGDDDLGVVGNTARSLEQCAAKNHSFAARAAEAFRTTKHPNAMTSLLLALRPESGPVLLDAAVGDDKERRLAAWYVLVRVGERSIAADPQHLIRMLFDTRVDLTLRRDMLGRVLSLQLIAEEAAREVCAAVVREGDAVLASEATHQLAGDSTRRAALVAAAARPEPLVRTQALRAMYALIEKHGDIRAACIAALDDPDEDVRITAAQILMGHDRMIWTDAAARDALAAKLATFARRGPKERMSALRLLASFPDAERPPEALLEMLADDLAAEQAIGLLLRAPRCTKEHLQPLLDGDDPVAAARAARVALARAADPSLVARVKVWLESPDVRLAREAATAAAGLPPDKITELGGALIRAARAGKEGVAWPACSALGRIAQIEPAARDALLAVADDPKNSAQIAVSCLLPALGEAGIARVIAFLDDPRREARREACVLIFSGVQNGVSGYTAAVPALERIAAGDDLELARLAKQALDALRKK